MGGLNLEARVCGTWAVCGRRWRLGLPPLLADCTSLSLAGLQVCSLRRCSHRADRRRGAARRRARGHHQEREFGPHRVCSLGFPLPPPLLTPSPIALALSQRSYVIYPPSDTTDEKIQDVRRSGGGGRSVGWRRQQRRQLQRSSSLQLLTTLTPPPLLLLTLQLLAKERARKI